jgi:hypothetical protein
VTATTGQSPTPVGDPDADVARPLAPTSASIEARYGRTPSSRRRRRLIAYDTAGGFAVVLFAWLFWGGVLSGLSTVDAQNTGHTILSDSEVEVTFDITVTPGEATTCALQALDSSFGVVGWKIVEIPGVAQQTQSLTETVRTSQQSVTGLIYRCWLT